MDKVTPSLPPRASASKIACQCHNHLLANSEMFFYRCDSLECVVYPLAVAGNILDFSSKIIEVVTKRSQFRVDFTKLAINAGEASVDFLLQSTDLVTNLCSNILTFFFDKSSKLVEIGLLLSHPGSIARGRLS
ncbi:hypothetical protein CWO89_43785 [Bradyrhizobium sp. Leo170]|nr:hypothetical protein CWO89_43785 [Bradyrhizobium sp. Leo170]